MPCRRHGQNHWPVPSRRPTAPRRPFPAILAALLLIVCHSPARGAEPSVESTARIDLSVEPSEDSRTKLKMDRSARVSTSDDAARMRRIALLIFVIAATTELESMP